MSVFFRIVAHFIVKPLSFADENCVNTQKMYLYECL